MACNIVFKSDSVWYLAVRTPACLPQPCLMTYTLGEKKPKLVWMFGPTIPPSVLELCFSVYFVQNQLCTDNWRMLKSRSDLERLFNMIVFPVSQSGLFRLLDESRQLISSISLSLLPAATGPVVRAQSCWTDCCGYLSLSLSLWTENNNNTEHRTQIFYKDKLLHCFLHRGIYEGDCRTRSVSDAVVVVVNCIKK